MITSAYTLPPIAFVGGETQKLRFNLITESRAVFDADNCSAVFAVLQYNNKGGTPVIEKQVSIEPNTEGIRCIGMVTLFPQETVDMYGRFVYQVTIRAADGTIEIPGQGLLDIAENIHKSYITA